MSTTTRPLRCVALAALMLGCAVGPVLAQAGKVYRCTGANGKVTLSDRRCPDDEAAGKADTKTTGKPDGKADARTAATPASASDGKACVEAKARVTERQLTPSGNNSQRNALRELQDEQRRLCGA